jgi:hypothetical protein
MRRIVSGLGRLAGKGTALWLAGCVAVFGLVSLHWPMVGDASYMHYVVFLMRHGMAPYRDIVEMNLPGSYMMESAVMTLLGPDSVGWRIYDFLLMGTAAAALMSLLKPRGRTAGIVAASLFLLVHGQDGVIMSGERDFAVSALALAAVALVFHAFRHAERSIALLVAAGVLLGVAMTIKPTTIPLDVCVVASIAFAARRRAGGGGQQQPWLRCWRDLSCR